MRLSKMLLLGTGLLLAFAGFAALGGGVLTMLELRGLTQRISGYVIRADSRQAVIAIGGYSPASNNPSNPSPPLSYSGELVVSQSGRNPPLKLNDAVTLLHPRHQPHRARLDVDYRRPFWWCVAGGAALIVAAFLLVFAFRARRSPNASSPS